MDDPHDNQEPANGLWEQIGRTIRFALTSNAGTARLCALMVATIPLAYYLR